MILDKIKALGLQCDIDVYKTVCHLRSQRSGMIQTEKQYQFAHMAIRQFIENLIEKGRPKKDSTTPKSEHPVKIKQQKVTESSGFTVSTQRARSLSTALTNSLV